MNPVEAWNYFLQFLSLQLIREKLFLKIQQQQKEKSRSNLAALEFFSAPYSCQNSLWLLSWLTCYLYPKSNYRLIVNPLYTYSSPVACKLSSPHYPLHSQAHHRRVGARCKFVFWSYFRFRMIDYRKTKLTSRTNLRVLKEKRKQIEWRFSFFHDKNI